MLLRTNKVLSVLTYFGGLKSLVENNLISLPVERGVPLGQSWSAVILSNRWGRWEWRGARPSWWQRGWSPTSRGP